jgi:hypothetical protein
MRSKLINVTGPVKEETVKMEIKQEPIKVDDFMQRFETEAAGFIVDELPHEFVHKFVGFLQQKNAEMGHGGEVDPMKVPKPKMDPNDPHLHVEEQKQQTDDKKRPFDVKQ